MSRAEQAALKAYPHKIEEHPKVMGGSITFDANNLPRGFYLEGYEQAEKDTKAELLEWAKEKRAALLNCDATEERKVAALSVCNAFIEKIKSL